MSLLAVTGATAGSAATQAAGDAGAGLTINFFWIIVSGLNFAIFLVIIWLIFFRPISGMLADRRQRIEQGLKDADIARREREAAADERQAILQVARREANEIVARAQKAADEVREHDLSATRQEIERLHAHAAGDIDAEKARALSEVRGQIADLALLAAGRVVGETRTGERERRLVEEFLTTVAPTGPAQQA
ncbi:MAG: F0F1 ATP synthase subunit B [Candidatus Limnocylindrales bacterium]